MEKKVQQNPEKSFQLTSVRTIKVKFLPPTNHTGDRIQISEEGRFEDRPTQRKTFPYDYGYDNVQEQGYQILKANGWNVISKGALKDSWIFLCENWGSEYNQIKDLKSLRELKIIK